MSEKMAFAKSGAVDPCGNQLSGEQKGMTLREYYVGQALAGLLAHPNKICIPSAMTYECVRLADALIAELEKEENRG